MNIFEIIIARLNEPIYYNDWMSIRQLKNGSLFIERSGNVSDAYIEYVIREYFKQMNITPNYLTERETSNIWIVKRLYWN